MLKEEYIISIVNQQSFKDIGDELEDILKTVLTENNIEFDRDTSIFHYGDIGYSVMIGIENGYLIATYIKDENYIEVRISSLKTVRTELLEAILSTFKPEKYGIVLLENNTEEGIDVSEVDIQGGIQ